MRSWLTSKPEPRYQGWYTPMGKYRTGEPCFLYTSQQPTAMDIGNSAHGLYWGGLEVNPDIIEYTKAQLPWMTFERSRRYMMMHEPCKEWDQSKGMWI